MSTSLDKLENKENGYENGKQNKTEHTRQTFCDEQCELLSRKSVYPSDYICLDKLDEKQLPEKAFYSKLIDSVISDEDYEHTQKVWQYFDMKTVRDYHNLYLKTDVLLLADVFGNLRDICLKKYELYPTWYFYCTWIGLGRLFEKNWSSTRVLK